jgi:hypothetical protein
VESDEERRRIKQANDKAAGLINSDQEAKENRDAAEIAARKRVAEGLPVLPSANGKIMMRKKKTKVRIRSMDFTVSVAVTATITVCVSSPLLIIPLYSFLLLYKVIHEGQRQEEGQDQDQRRGIITSHNIT